MKSAEVELKKSCGRKTQRRWGNRGEQSTRAVKNTRKLLKAAFRRIRGSMDGYYGGPQASGSGGLRQTSHPTGADIAGPADSDLKKLKSVYMVDQVRRAKIGSRGSYFKIASSHLRYNASNPITTPAPLSWSWEHTPYQFPLFANK